jgi:nitroreductase
MATAGRLSMSLGEAIFAQRAIRRLKPEPIPDADLQTILAAGARAPDGGNVQPWRLNRRLPDLATVRSKVVAWQQHRNIDRPTVKWHFTTAQARRKLGHLYPIPA